MMKHLAIILLLVSTVFGQQRIRPIDLTPETLTLIADSAQAAISRNPGFTLDSNSKAVISSTFLSDSLVAADTTALKLRKGAADGAMIYLAGLSGSNANGGGWFVYGDSAYAEGGVAFGAVVNGKQWIRQDFIANRNGVKLSWFGAVGDASNGDDATLEAADAYVTESSADNVNQIYIDRDIYIKNTVTIGPYTRLVANETGFFDSPLIHININDSTVNGLIFAAAGDANVNPGAGINNIGIYVDSYVDTAVVMRNPGYSTALVNVGVYCNDYARCGVYVDGTGGGSYFLNVSYLHILEAMYCGIFINGSINFSMNNGRIHGGAKGVHTSNGVRYTLNQFWIEDTNIGIYADNVNLLNINNLYLEGQITDIQILNTEIANISNSNFTVSGVLSIDSTRSVTLNNNRLGSLEIGSKLDQLILFGNNQYRGLVELAPYVFSDWILQQIPQSCQLIALGVVDRYDAGYRNYNHIDNLFTDTTYTATNINYNSINHDNLAINADSVHFYGAANWFKNSQDLTFAGGNWGIPGSPDAIAVTADQVNNIDSIANADKIAIISDTGVNDLSYFCNNNNFNNNLVEKTDYTFSFYARAGSGDISVIPKDGYWIGDTINIGSGWNRYSVVMPHKISTTYLSLTVVGDVGDYFFIDGIQFSPGRDLTDLVRSYGSPKFYGVSKIYGSPQMQDTLVVDGIMRVGANGANVDSIKVIGTNPNDSLAIYIGSRIYYAKP